MKCHAARLVVDVAIGVDARPPRCAGVGPLFLERIDGIEIGRAPGRDMTASDLTAKALSRPGAVSASVAPVHGDGWKVICRTWHGQWQDIAVVPRAVRRLLRARIIGLEKGPVLPVGDLGRVDAERAPVRQRNADHERTPERLPTYLVVSGIERSDAWPALPTRVILLLALFVEPGVDIQQRGARAARAERGGREHDTKEPLNGCPGSRFLRRVLYDGDHGQGKHSAPTTFILGALPLSRGTAPSGIPGPVGAPQVVGGAPSLPSAV